MATVSPSVLRSKYAIAGVLALLAAGLGTIGYQNWNNSTGLFGDMSAESDASRTIAGSDAQVGGLTGIDIVDNAIDMLAGRSPGERTVGLSGKGKGKGPARAYRYTRSPAAQALEEAFSSPAGASRVIPERSAPAAVAPSIILPPELFGVAAAPGLTDAILPGVVGGGPSLGGGFPFPGGFSVGGGIGGGGAAPPPVVTPPVTPVVPAIPEPATWLMLLLGMAGVGAAMRTGKARASTMAVPRTAS